MALGSISTQEAAIGRDLDLCDAGLALTSGHIRRRYTVQRKACFVELHRMNVAAGLDALTDAALLAELGA